LKNGYDPIEEWNIFVQLHEINVVRVIKEGDKNIDQSAFPI